MDIISTSTWKTDEDTKKEISTMNCYSYRLTIRKNAENHILKCWKYIVDMYMKIEIEQLLNIQLNQIKLHSEKYIHLSDEVVNGDNVNPN